MIVIVIVITNQCHYTWDKHRITHLLHHKNLNTERNTTIDTKANTTTDTKAKQKMGEIKR